MKPTCDTLEKVALIDAWPIDMVPLVDPLNLPLLDHYKFTLVNLWVKNTYDSLEKVVSIHFWPMR